MGKDKREIDGQGQREQEEKERKMGKEWSRKKVKERAR